MCRFTCHLLWKSHIHLQLECGEEHNINLSVHYWGSYPIPIFRISETPPGVTSSLQCKKPSPLQLFLPAWCWGINYYMVAIYPENYRIFPVFEHHVWISVSTWAGHMVWETAAKNCADITVCQFISREVYVPARRLLVGVWYFVINIFYWL